MNVGVTEPLKRFLQQNPQEYEGVRSGIEHYIAEYQRAKKECDHAPSLAAAFHKSIDGLVKETLELTKEKMSCLKGCAHCCYINVDITSDEAELILLYAEHKKIEIDWDKLELQASHEDDRRKLKYEDRACVFLNKENNECRIYDHRPMSCRKHFVQSKPDKCNSSKYPGGSVKIYSFNIVELILSALFNVLGAASMTKQLINKRREQK